MRNQLESLKDQEVEVVYNGVIYRGRLTGASGEEIYLDTVDQKLSLQMSEITSIKKAPASTGFEGYVEGAHKRFEDPFEESGE